MTDRIKGLTVIIDHNIRDDDCEEQIVKRIRKIQGVRSVTKHVRTGNDYMVYALAMSDIERVLIGSLLVFKTYKEKGEAAALAQMGEVLRSR